LTSTAGAKGSFGNSFIMSQALWTTFHTVEDQAGQTTVEFDDGKTATFPNTEWKKLPGDRDMCFTLILPGGELAKSIGSRASLKVGADPALNEQVLLRPYDWKQGGRVSSSGILKKNQDGQLEYTNLTDEGHCGTAVINKIGRVVGLHGFGASVANGANGGFKITAADVAYVASLLGTKNLPARQ